MYDIFYNIFKLNWLLSQLFIYVFLFLVIIIIQNVFLIIIGDGYVKAKYFNKNNWVKAGDKCIINEEEEGEDPLECFVEHNPQAEKSTQALVKMLKADKEFLMTEYYASKGIKHNPHLYDEKKRIKSPEELTRMFNHQINEVLKEYEELIDNIDNDQTIGNIDEKEKRKDEVYTTANMASKAVEYKLEKLDKYLV